MTVLRSSKAPNLPIAPVEYMRGYNDGLTNVLRLYFNQVDHITQNLLAPAGGHYLSFPHIAASDSTDQYAGGDNTPTAVNWNAMDSGLGFTLNAPGSATCNYTGTYKITYSAQLANTDNAIHDATFWLKVNSSDVANSATYFTVPARKSAGNPSYLCGYSEVTFSVQYGDVIELYWATDKAATSGGTLGLYIFADPAQTSPYSRPAIPSMIGSITFVSEYTP